jgi:hypothetical protein
MGEKRPDRSSQGKQEPQEQSPSRVKSVNHRGFLARVGGVAAASVAVDALGLTRLAVGTTVAEAGIGPDKPKKRRERAYRVRRDTARFRRDLPLPDHLDNGDETLFATKIGSYSKALPHNDLGQVDLPAYSALISALTSGDPNAFEAVPQGGSVRQVNPQASYTYSLEGPDSHHVGIIAPPTFPTPAPR